MARPTKRTPEREQRLVQAIRAGNTRRAACAYAGITEDTLTNWARRYSGFSDILTRAEADAEVRMMALIHQAAPNDWRAAAWWLERRRSDEYGRRERIELDVREIAGRYADQIGVDADTLIAEATRIINGNHD